MNSHKSKVMPRFRNKTLVHITIIVCLLKYFQSEEKAIGEFLSWNSEIQSITNFENVKLFEQKCVRTKKLQNGNM